MPRPRFNKLTQGRQNELLERAATEFSLHGYQGASLNSIISGIGLSKGAFYYYFDDKADLFATVTHFAFEKLVGLGAGAFDFRQLAHETFWPSLERWSLELTARLDQLPWAAGLGKLLYDPPHVDGVDGMIANQFDQVHEWLADLLRHGREVGAVRQDLPLGLLQQMVTGAMEASDRWFVDHWNELDSGQTEELAALTFGVARRMLEVNSDENGVAGAETLRKEETLEK